VFRHGNFGPIEWAAVRRPVPGEEVCGDHPIALDVGDSAALFGVIDGLGHGAPAATAALRAVETVEAGRSEPLDVVIQLCHRALTDTRGVAMTLARVDFETDTLSWIGIGNVTADLVAKHPTGVEVRSSALLAGGIVGYRMPQTLLAHQVSMAPGDLLVIASDGIAEDHLSNIDFAAHATTIAKQLVGQYGKETDDALVLAARHRGSS
jgi:negative regulator of sigma-B (phosphoserine phosphatase)